MNSLDFSILLCLDFKILLCLDLKILLCLDFSILLCLDFKILLCLDLKILLYLDFSILLCYMYAYKNLTATSIQVSSESPKSRKTIVSSLEYLPHSNFQKRIVSAETIRGNTVCTVMVRFFMDQTLHLCK